MNLKAFTDVTHIKLRFFTNKLINFQKEITISLRRLEIKVSIKSDHQEAQNSRKVDIPACYCDSKMIKTMV